MALSDLEVYNEQAYSVMTETLQQQLDAFNSASSGTIQLVASAHMGDFDNIAFWAKIAGGTVRRRNPYGTGAVAGKSLKMNEAVSVKVGAGTPPISLNPGELRWIQRNPAEAGAAMGQQLAKDTLADMLNTALGSTVAALSGETAIVKDVTGDASNNSASWSNLGKAASLFGDASSRVAAWIMHSTPGSDIYQNNLANAERLFTYGTVNVLRDPMGRLIVQTDSDSLTNQTNGTISSYNILGLTTGGVIVGQNDDYDSNLSTLNGDENLLRTFQAEWSYQLGIRGFSWNKAVGGAAPNDAALLSSANWKRYSTSEKDLAGVLLKVKAAA